LIEERGGEIRSQRRSCEKGKNQCQKKKPKKPGKSGDIGRRKNKKKGNFLQGNFSRGRAHFWGREKKKTNGSLTSMGKKCKSNNLL